MQAFYCARLADGQDLSLSTAPTASLNHSSALESVMGARNGLNETIQNTLVRELRTNLLFAPIESNRLAGVSAGNSVT